MVPQKRMSLWLAARLAAIQVLACIVVVIARVVYVYGPAFWQNTTAVNFIAAWMPALIGVVVAFVPDKDLERHVRLRWRLTVAACFVGWSVVLWHQQTLTEASDKKGREELVTAAVEKSNVHADSKFHEVETQVGEVKDGLKTTEDRISTKLDQATSAFSSGLKGVGKPDPPELAKLQFTFMDDSGLPEPIQSTTVSQASDGSYPLIFAVRNTSAVQAEGVDVWVHICDQCSFAGEPAGFEHPKGSNEHQRHKFVGSINPGAAFDVSEVKINAPSSAVQIHVGFYSSCKNCGKIQPMVDYVLIPSPSPSFKPPSVQ